MLLEQAEGQAAKHGQVFGTLPSAHSIVILCKADIELPMQVVFDAPMITQCFAIGFRTRFTTADEEDDLRAGLAFADPLSTAHADGLDGGPFSNVEVGRVDNDVIATSLLPTMTMI